MRPRWKKVLADLWGNLTRSSLVIASIVVGLFALGVIATVHSTLTTQMPAGYASVNPANIQMAVSPFGQDLIDQVKNNAQVAEVEGARIFTLRVETSPGEWETIKINAIDQIDEMMINQLKLMDGIFPPDDRQIVIDENKLSSLNLRLNDQVIVQLPSGRTRQMKLVGIVQDQTIGSAYPGGFFMETAQGYVTTDTLEWLGQPSSLNYLYITVKENGTDENALRSVASTIRKDIEDNGYTVFSTSVRSSRNHPNSIYVDAMAGILFVLGALVMFLSSFLITSTFQALLNQQVQQIGVMKIVGGRSRQITGIYMAMIFVFGVLGFLIALPLSNQAAFGLLKFLASKINFGIQIYQVAPLSVLLQISVALLIPQLAGVFPILKGAQITIQEATSGIRQESVSSRPGWVERQAARLRGVPRPLLISLRNTFRRKGRLILTLITLSLGGSIFIATLNVKLSIQDYVERVGKYFMADVNLTLDQPYRIHDIQNELSSLPEIKVVEGWADARGEILRADGTVADSFHILAPPAGTPLVQPIMLGGRWIVPGDQNAITLSERFKELFPDLKIGDTITLRINGDETHWIVVGFFQLVGKSAGYLAYTGYDYLSKLLGQGQETMTYRIVASQSGLTPDQQKSLALEIENYLQARGYSVRETTAGGSLITRTTDGLSILTFFLLIMSFLTALVGSIGLMGTMSMNVLERTREIGVMRAIGASDWAVIRMVIVEGLLIGMISWGLSILLAFPISSLLNNTINMALFGASTRLVFTPKGFAIWLGIVLALSILASILPARNAARLTIREVLAYE
jgi:putative ABC transport system permease protein